jgi:4-amino-4-deoxy-L-arabinose transferase-like glycosyltransferase
MNASWPGSARAGSSNATASIAADPARPSSPVAGSLRWERAVAIFLALARTALCVYRAATQSFVHDEAFSYNLFLSHSWRDLYRNYDATNHVLFSLLAKLSIKLFGISTWGLRLPTVIAGFFLMLGVWRLLESSKSRAVRWVAFVAIGLHPLILDFSVAARGYGLALALLAWALYQLRVHEASPRADILAGVLLGSSCSANLTVGFPAAGLLAALLLTGQGGDGLRRTLRVALPAAAVFCLVCGGALRSAGLNNFYVGFPTLRSSLINLALRSIYAYQRTGLFGTDKAAEFLAIFMAPAAALFLAVDSIREWRRGKAQKALVSIAAIVAAAGMIAAHYLVGLNYPIDRTGLAMMLLFGLAWALAAGNTPYRWLRGASLVAGILLAIQFATQFEVSYFEIWFYDRSTKEIARRIAEDSRGKPPGSISIGATWLYQPALEYYRTVDHMTSLRPVVRTFDTLIAGQDYYVLHGSDPHYSAAHGRTVLLSDPFAGVVLLK